MTTTASTGRAERRYKARASTLAKQGSAPRSRSTAIGELDLTYSSKRENMRRMAEVDARYLAQAPSAEARPCCGRCRTPFSICANKGCSCHG